MGLPAGIHIGRANKRLRPCAKESG